MTAAMEAIQGGHHDGSGAPRRPEPATRAGVELQGLTKSFRGGRGAVQAVAGIDLAVAGGETVALLGPNGAGKSITIDMLLGLLNPDAGSVQVFGMPPLEAVASGRIGAMLQTGSLIHDLTARELQADAFADRIVLMTQGRVVAEGPPTEIKSMAGSRRIRATLPEADIHGLERLDGIVHAERHGEAVLLACSDSDAAIRTVLARHPQASDIEIVGAGLEEAFVELTRGAPNRHEQDLGSSSLPAPLYFIVGLLTFGTMNSMLSAGARIAAERSSGCNRQLRVTPLLPRAYIRTKVLTGYVMSLVTISLLYAAGFALGVRLPAGRWLEMTGLILLGLIPFAALGILIGHLVSADSIGPALGGTTALLAFLGGVWFPLGKGGVLLAIGQALPSYWLVQAARVGGGGSGWGLHGWAVLAAWSTAAGLLARHACLKDTKKT